MQIRKKQLLGFVGLAAVAIMTAIACSLPGLDASAADNDTATGGVNVNVTVVEKGSHVTILSPRQQIYTDSTIQVSLILNKVRGAKQYLVFKGGAAGDSRYELDAIPEGQTTYETTIDMAPYKGYGTYEYMVVYTPEGGSEMTESVEFEYRAASLEFNDKLAENEDPVVDIRVNKSVVRGSLQVYSGAKPLFVDADGKEVPLVFTQANVDPATGKLELTLPFKKYKIPAGTYSVVMTSYNEAGEVVSINTIDLKYAPKAPDVPGTGSLLLDDLNISRLDYLLTGLIAFGAMAGFAIYLVCRRSRR